MLPQGRGPAAASPRAPRRAYGSVLVCVAVSLIAGGCHAAAWIVPGVWYGAWISQILLIALGFIRPWRSACGWGLLVGLIVTGSAFSWGIKTLQSTMDAPIALAIALYGLLIFFEALGFAAFCGSVSFVARRGRMWYALIPCTWTAVDYWLPRIFAWKIGYTQLEWSEMLQVAAVVGSDGIGFVLTAAAAIPAVALLGQGRLAGNQAMRAANRPFVVGYCLLAAALFVSTLLFGHLQMSYWEGAILDLPKLRIALIQVDPEYVGSEKKLRDQSLAVHDQVDLICWPETSIGVYSSELTHFRDVENTLRLSRDSQTNLEPAKDFHCHLLAGGKVYASHAADDGPFTMSTFLIGPTQDVLGKYNKRTLMPLGEYVPGQSFYPPLRHWMTIEHIIEAGDDPEPLRMTTGTPLGVLMCYEDTIPRNARHTALAGAEVLLSLIQGTAFENPLTLIQHQRLAVLRAVENRRCFVRCASTGVTCLVSPTGKILSSLAPQTEGSLVVETPLIKGRSVYTRSGDVLPFLCTTFLLIVATRQISGSGLVNKRNSFLGIHLRSKP